MPSKKKPGPRRSMAGSERFELLKQTFVAGAPLIIAEVTADELAGKKSRGPGGASSGPRKKPTTHHRGAAGDDADEITTCCGHLTLHTKSF